MSARSREILRLAQEVNRKKNNASKPTVIAEFQVENDGVLTLVGRLDPENVRNSKEVEATDKESPKQSEAMLSKSQQVDNSEQGLLRLFLDQRVGMGDKRDHQNHAAGVSQEISELQFSTDETDLVHLNSGLGHQENTVEHLLAENNVELVNVEEALTWIPPENSDGHGLLSLLEQQKTGRNDCSQFRADDSSYINIEALFPEQANSEDTDEGTSLPEITDGNEILPTDIDEEENSVEEEQIRKRSKRHKVDPEKWTSNANKKKREQGLAYSGKAKIGNKWKYNLKKPAKVLANPCKCSWSKKASVLKCTTLSEENRNKIFNYYWTLSWAEKKMYVKDLAKLEKVKRRRGNEERSRRDYTVKYYLKFKNDYFRVCKKMFLGTLGMKETVVLNWIKAMLDDL